MVEALLNYISSHQDYALWIVFGSLLLAGMSVPISIDVVLVFCAFLAASALPELTFAFYFTILFGCIISGWIAYSMGRFFGRRLLRTAIFTKLVSPKRLDQVAIYYKKYGVYTLILGRFIPFGVRNCIFLTTGLSKMPFLKFALIDACACTLWTSIMFFSFYQLGRNLDLLLHNLKALNIVIFSVFAVAIIILSCYKYAKKKS
jgi:membrane-associated protein